MRDQDFQKIVLDIISHRSWEDVSERWLQYIKTIEPPGSSPDKLVELFSLESFIKKNDFTDEVESIDNIPYLRDGIYKQSVYLMHKALHVSGVAENCVFKGQLTWSLTEAYQSSVFSAKAIIGFLGIAFVSYEKKTYIIDLWSNSKDDDIKIHEIDIPKFEQRHTWMIFIALIRNVQIKLWDRAYNKLKTFEYKDFSKQRNNIFYDNTSWLFEDLHISQTIDGFGCLNKGGFRKKLKFEKDTDFTLISSFFLFKMSFKLLESILLLSVNGDRLLLNFQRF